MNFGYLGVISFDLHFVSALLSIVVIDLILAGDNAVVIAMAVRSLPHDQRKKGILFGAAAAVLLRVALTFFVAQLLVLSYVKLAGGILILWVAVKLFIEGAPDESGEQKAATVWQAIKVIVIADITMSLDNMLAVGGASHGNMFLLLFGLGLSIPFIVLTSNLLSLLMDRYPVIITIGAAILGKVGGEMIITDPFMVRLLPISQLAPGGAAPAGVLQYSVEAFFALGVIVSGRLWMRRMIRREDKREAVVLHADENAGARRPKAILTLSREFGSGGREIGQAVARDLGYAYVDRETLLADIGTDGPKWEQWAKDLDEHCPTVWEKYDWSFRGFAALVQWHILEHARKGGVVIMGRGANFLLNNVPQAFRGRVTASFPDRIERVVKREGVDRDTAEWLCEKTDNERSCFLRSIYGKPWDDPVEYDRVVQTSGLSLDDVVAAIERELKDRELRATDAAQHNLSMLAAASKIKAGLCVNPRIFIPVLDVVYDGAGIVLRGVTHTPDEHKLIVNEAQRLADGLPLRCELHYRK